MMYDEIFLPEFYAPTRFYCKRKIENKDSSPMRSIDREMYRRLLESFNNPEDGSDNKQTWI